MVEPVSHAITVSRSALLTYDDLLGLRYAVDFNLRDIEWNSSQLFNKSNLLIKEAFERKNLFWELWSAPSAKQNINNNFKHNLDDAWH